MTASVALAILMSSGWALIFIFRAEDFTAAAAEFDPGERRWAKLTPIVLAVHVTLCCVALNWAAAPPWRVAVAALVFLLGLAFWFVGRVQIGPLRQTRLPSQAPQRLRRDAAFGIVRHPLFCSYLVATAAPLIVVPRVGLGLSYAACVVVIVKRTLQEERRLLQQMGAQYREYSRSVKRLLPFVW